jgi:tRNA/rRNA methyltransferase
MTSLDRIRIVLVEPAGALNVGSIARIMKNMGLSRLVLVNPQCDPAGMEARRMAVHAADVLATAVQVETLPDALEGCQQAIATVGRDYRDLEIELEPPRTALPWLLAPEHTGDAALIFGREDRGLTNLEVNYAQRLVRIPSSEIYPSLNLAQAVAICCYELFTAITLTQPSGVDPYPSMARSARSTQGSTVFNGFSTTHSLLHAQPSPTADLASREAIEQFYQTLETLLLNIGYLYPHTATSRMKKFRRLLNRAYPSKVEVAMLQGIISQIEWALQKER